ncbi:DEKNAAC104447 [Brettanomyces naardenensis]|uniref:DEKNAAC104447 n=1 Tax=Brettanomyces naardenensis TaxID=13370 RepID=A0A448YR59_BRENA|nr:DEKNAAC104447 [Brettanomyces naardenensis]
MFGNILRPLMSLQLVATRAMAAAAANESGVINQARFLTKTHRSAYRRWRKTAEGYKHGKQGRKHGNAGFGNRILKKRTGIAYSTSDQTRRLKKMMPFL